MGELGKGLVPEQPSLRNSRDWFHRPGLGEGKSREKKKKRKEDTNVRRRILAKYPLLCRP